MKNNRLLLLLSLFFFGSIGLWWSGYLPFVHRHQPVAYHTNVPLISYRCEKCGTPNALSAPEGNLADVDKTNNADNFVPVITSVTPDTFVPIIETARLRFRCMKRSDTEEYYRILSNAEMAQSDTGNIHTSIADTQKMIDEVYGNYRQGKRAVWAIEEKCSQKLIGKCSFVQWYPKDQRAVLSWSIDSAYWGRGYGTECARMLIEYGVKYLNINRLQVIVRLDNAASRRVAIKAGMSHHCRLRDHWLLKNEWLSFDQYAILRHEIADKLTGVSTARDPASSNAPQKEQVITISSHRCRTCNPDKPLGCHDGAAGDAPDDNYKNYRPAVTKRFDGEYVVCFETKRLRARELTLPDLGRLHDILTDKRTIGRTSFTPYKSKSATRSLLKKWRHGYTQYHTVPYGIEVKKTGELIGIGGFTSWYPDGQRCFIAYTMDHHFDDHDYQTELLRGLIEFGFTDMQFRRVEILVRASDAIGFAAASNAGMSHEGTQRGYKKVGNEFVDFEMFGILKRQIR